MNPRYFDEPRKWTIELSDVQSRKSWTMIDELYQYFKQRMAEEVSLAGPMQTPPVEPQRRKITRLTSQMTEDEMFELVGHVQTAALKFIESRGFDFLYIPNAYDFPAAIREAIENEWAKACNLKKIWVKMG